MEQVRGVDPESGRTVDITIEHGVITAVAPAGEAVDGLAFIAPGFFDIQINGYKGIDYSDTSLDSNRIFQLVHHLAAAGTTRHLATIVTRPAEATMHCLRTIARARRESPMLQSAIHGIHLEGPWISSEDGPRGAHDPRYVRAPDFEEFLRLQDAAEGLVKIVTLAPELEGALEFIEKITSLGIIAAIGHTAARPDQIRDAVTAGCRLSTHLGNGSHAQLPRLSNYLWEQLAADELAASVIADGFHLPPAVLRVIARAKGLNSLILVSDVSLLGGMMPGLYHWGNLDAEVFEDGHVGLAGTPYLAGAGHLLDWDIPQFMHATSATLAQTLRLCTSNPAHLLANGGQTLSCALEPGASADLVLFDFEDGQRLSVRKTFIQGVPIASRI